MLTPDEVKELNKKVDIGALLTFLGAPIANLRDLNRKGVDYRINAWYRGGDNPGGLGITYYFDKEKWYCTDFTRKEFGNIDLLDFMTKVLKIPFMKAVDHLVFAAGKDNGFKGRTTGSIASSNAQPLQKLERPKPINPSIMNIFEPGLHDYWLQRGFTHEIAKRFNLGFCSANYGNLKHRLIIPVDDELNRLVAVQGRSLNDRETPKYTYSDPEQGESAKLTLYNYTYARYYGQQRGWVGVVEGASSVWRAEMYDYKNFCATLSTSVTDRQVEMLIALKLNIVIFFDFDPAHTMAGQIGAMKLAKRLKERGVKVWIVNPNMVCGPDDLTKDQFFMSMKGAFEYVQ